VFWALEAASLFLSCSQPFVVSGTQSRCHGAPPILACVAGDLSRAGNARYINRFQGINMNLVVLIIHM